MVVLYAEDDMDDFNTFIEILDSIDPTIRCINARNGVEVLEILENSIVLPDFIFLDINMPTMDGKSCLKFIKKDERFSEIPVIIFTTSSYIKDIELCMQLGATEYIQKPTTIEESIKKVSKFFQ